MMLLKNNKRSYKRSFFNTYIFSTRLKPKWWSRHNYNGHWKFCAYVVCASRITLFRAISGMHSSSFSNNTLQRIIQFLFSSHSSDSMPYHKKRWLAVNFQCLRIQFDWSTCTSVSIFSELKVISCWSILLLFFVCQ